MKDGGSFHSYVNVYQRVHPITEAQQMVNHPLDSTAAEKNELKTPPLILEQRNDSAPFTYADFAAYICITLW